MDGYAVKARLDADPATRDVPVIALTAATSPRDIRRGRAAGFDAYLTKPLDLTALGAALNDVLTPGLAGAALTPKAGGGPKGTCSSKVSVDASVRPVGPIPYARPSAVAAASWPPPGRLPVARRLRHDPAAAAAAAFGRRRERSGDPDGLARRHHLGRPGSLSPRRRRLDPGPATGAAPARFGRPERPGRSDPAQGGPARGRAACRRLSLPHRQTGLAGRRGQAGLCRLRLVRLSHRTDAARAEVLQTDRLAAPVRPAVPENDRHMVLLGSLALAQEPAANSYGRNQSAIWSRCWNGSARRAGGWSCPGRRTDRTWT